jgi:hypothetical protein
VERYIDMVEKRGRIFIGYSFAVIGTVFLFKDSVDLSITSTNSIFTYSSSVDGIIT